jgi:hypothetical protein
MACPYFDPQERLPLASGSLGDLYTGFCRASGEPFRPDDETLADRCNLGYARGHCPRFPRDSAADSVRFMIAARDSGAIRVLYSLERDHRPVTAGALDYSIPESSFTAAPGDPLGRLARAYVRSFLRRSRQ